MFCYQKTLKSPTLPIDRRQWWAIVKAPETKRLITTFRKTGDDSKKRSLPGFIFQSRFTESLRGSVKSLWRRQDHSVLTGLVVMDIDDVENPQAVIDGWLSKGEDWMREHGIVLIYITPSGHGIKVVFIARMAWGNLIDNQYEMAQLLDVTVDESGKDSSRMSFSCMEEDVKYIDEERLFGYDDPEYEKKFGEAYRKGQNQPTKQQPEPTPQPSEAAVVSDIEAAGLGEFCGVPIQQIVDAWIGPAMPTKSQRHKTSLWLADQLRYLTCNNAEWIEQILRAQPWVKDIVELRNENVGQTVKSAMNYNELKMPPKRMMEALKKCGITRQMYKETTLAAAENEASASALSDRQGRRNPLAVLPYDDWERDISELWEHYPPLKAVCQGLCSHKHQWPAAFFATGHCGVNLMTRCTYHHYYQPAKLRRLNSDVHVIGDPATGKSFVGDIYELLMRPILEADKKAIDQLTDFKLQQQGRAYSTKEQKKDAITRPKVVKRDHDSRTSNAEFILDHLNAKEWVDGREMQLHLTTFDSELDNTTAMAKGGGWIDKKFFELKAFHNEKDGQQYANKDSVPVTMYIHYNLLFTGTPLALYRKVNERNFGDGLATRLAVIPLPPSNFEMVELMPESYDNSQQLKVLDDFAVRLDQRHGELPIRKLIEHTYYWTRDRMEMAAFNDDHADELLIKRCCYYGIAMAVPFIDDRHKAELEKTGKYTPDDIDLRLCSLALDMQYQTQHYWFYELARQYFDNQTRDDMNRQRRSKFDDCFLRLPNEFDVSQFTSVFGYGEGQDEAIRKMLFRLKKQERIVQTGEGSYKKCA